MRIVSLLPSLTELACALGHRASLVGVTHECDYPPGVERLPHLTRSRIPAGASSAAIDTMVLHRDLLALLSWSGKSASHGGWPWPMWIAAWTGSAGTSTR